MTVRFTHLAAVLVLVAAPFAALADGLEGAKPVIARAHGDAVVIWDATTLVTQIVKDKVTDSEANARLLRAALRALAATAPQLDAAKTITVRVTYARSGDVSPAYGAATFAGVERYATLEISGADAKSDKDKWKETAAASGPLTLSSAIVFTVIGKLPPR